MPLYYKILKIFISCIDFLYVLFYNCHRGKEKQDMVTILLYIESEVVCNVRRCTITNFNNFSLYKRRSYYYYICINYSFNCNSLQRKSYLCLPLEIWFFNYNFHGNHILWILASVIIIIYLLQKVKLFLFFSICFLIVFYSPICYNIY